MKDLVAEAQAELYAADPDSFTARRNELAASAREAGHPSEAKQIAGLRKPTRSAWIVNRLVRSDPAVRSRLDAMAADLHEAADGARIRELTTARSRLIGELAQAALAGIPAPPAALREEVTATLDAAIADPGVAGRLGMLTRAEQYAGFGPVDAGSFTAAPPAPQEPAPEKPQKPEKKAKDPAEAAAEREARRQEKINTAERLWSDASRALESALAAERGLEETVRGLEDELAAARQRLAEARRQSYKAESRQQKAARELSRLRP